MKQKRFLRYLQLLTCLLFILSWCSAYGAEATKFREGAQFPKFTLAAPDSPEVQKYLSLEGNEPFTLSKIGSKLVLVEFIGIM